MKYYLVIDLEMCRVPKLYRQNYDYNQEIIQIGAALMNEDFEIIDKYGKYVKPKYGDVDQFIKNLTNISRKELSKAELIEEVIKDFIDWIPEGDVTAVSWSMSDFAQIDCELRAKGIEVGEKFRTILDNWYDCQIQFSEKMNRPDKNYSLQEALIATDVCADGRAHDGLADAINTAELFAKMQREEELILNEYYKKAHNQEEEEGLTFSLGDLLKNAMK